MLQNPSHAIKKYGSLGEKTGLLSKQVVQKNWPAGGKESDKEPIATLCKGKEKEVSEGSIIVTVKGTLTSTE